MNKAQRKTLAANVAALEVIYSEIEAILEDEREKLAMMEENFSETERYQVMEQGADDLDSALADIETAKEYIDNAMNG